MLELEQLLLQGSNKVAVDRVAVDFESAVAGVAGVGHCSVRQCFYFKGCFCVGVSIVCVVCLLDSFNDKNKINVMA